MTHLTPSSGYSSDPLPNALFGNSGLFESLGDNAIWLRMLGVLHEKRNPDKPGDAAEKRAWTFLLLHFSSLISHL